MIDLYTAKTPNGYKVSMALEEMELPYTAHAVDLTSDGQFAADFVRICPNSKIPAIVDHDGPDGPISLFESGAILFYLAEKTGQLMPTSAAGRAEVMQWVCWQVANIGPIFGNANHFARNTKEQIPYATDRFLSESARLLGVLDRELSDKEFLTGQYSVADIATFAWVKAGFDIIRSAKPEIIGEGANVGRWLAAISARPATQKGMQVPG